MHNSHIQSGREVVFILELKGKYLIQKERQILLKIRWLTQQPKQQILVVKKKIERKL